MKIITKSTILVLIFSACFLSVNAQTERQRLQITRNYDLAKLKELQSQLSDDFSKNYAKASEVAREKNLPITYRRPDGRRAVLQGIDDKGNLLYNSTDNAGSAATSRANTLYPGGALGLNLKGQGMYAGVWDEFLAYPLHLDLKDRVLNPLGSTVGYGIGTDDGDHGTHVTGTIISSGANSNDGTGFLRGRGMAYEATVYNYDWNNDIGKMTGAAAEGMLLSNHSYGLPADSGDQYLYLYGAYISLARNLDNILFNAPYYQPLFAAGNDRDDANQIYNPNKGGHDLLSTKNVAKNVITVAAVREVPSYTGPSSVVMSDFSNYGPTDDNRIKPDISDKGVLVYSTSNNPISKTSYVYKDGTSMATPGATGTLLLLQQHYSNTYPNPPASWDPEVDGDYVPFMKAATIKALMCHTADEAGNAPGPDSRFGWGLINAEKAAQTITKSVTNQSVIAELTLAQGQTYKKNISVAAGEPLMATIVWTDRPGMANIDAVVDLATPVLVNDLDIRIKKVGGETYFPWRLADIANGYDAPAVNDGDNFVDNVERVDVEGASGDYEITVTHKPGVDLVGGSQDFSLIITGGNLNLATEKNDFKVFNVWPNPAKNVLNISLQSDSFDDARVALYDVQGRRVLNQVLNTSGDHVNGVLDLSVLNKGIYLLKIDQGAKQASKKIIVD